jgi:hypothetical protein
LLPILTGGRRQSEASERINAVNYITLDQTDEETLSYEVSDEALEAAAGTPSDAATSLWSSFTPGGCTCVTGTD